PDVQSQPEGHARSPDQARLAANWPPHCSTREKYRWPRSPRRSTIHAEHAAPRRWTMRKASALVFVLVATVAFAGFKVKLVKPKKPEQFQARASSGAVTMAADLLLEGKDQKDYFFKELAPSNIVAVRLAVFNSGREEVVLPLDRLQLLGPDGSEIALIP